MKKGIILVFWVILLNSMIYAQKKTDDFYAYSKSLAISLNGGLVESRTDYLDAGLDIRGRALLEYFLPSESKSIFGFRLGGGWQKFSGKANLVGAPLNFTSDVFFAEAGITYNYKLTQQFLPFLSIGLQNLWMSSDVVERIVNPSDPLVELVNDKTAMALTGEIGARILVSDKLAITGSIGLNQLTSDNLDHLIVGGSRNDFYSAYNLGFSYSIDLSNNKDSDGDGILDENDACPYQPEDFDGFMDEDGCPEYDNDNDGISDMKDACPNEPEDFDGFQDRDGCPDYDNDNDGILDVDDKCPDEAEDKDGFEDNDGCPDFDNDNDGILDENDKCPNEPETFNNFEDSDGCPDEAPAPVKIEIPEPDVKENNTVAPPKKVTPPKPTPVSLPSEFQIHGEVTFTSSTANIKQSAYPELNRIAEVLKSSPSTLWRIEGHMDNQGSPAELKQLSATRAQAILNYFVSKGLSPSQFQVIGLGDQYPAASNSTAYGRMKNRRIMIKRLR